MNKTEIAINKALYTFSKEIYRPEFSGELFIEAHGGMADVYILNERMYARGEYIDRKDVFSGGLRDMKSFFFGMRFGLTADLPEEDCDKESVALNKGLTKVIVAIETVMKEVNDE